MLTVTCEPNVSKNTLLAQNETLPSDSEISRRVWQIRSQWTLAERLRRRREAEQRFTDLMIKLVGGEAA